MVGGDEMRRNRFDRSKDDIVFDSINYCLMTAVLVIVLYPLVYILGASFSDPYKVASGEMWLYPVEFTLEGYQYLLKYSEIWVSYGNTIVYTIAGTSLNLVVTLPCAYALSRKDFVGRGWLMLLIMIPMYFTGGLVPTYITVKRLGLLDTRLMLIVGGATATYNLIVSRTFFSSTIPMELQEAGVIDGCSNWKLFIRIVMPLSMPIVAVMAMFFGVGHWNEYFGAMIYLKSRSLYPLQLILREILIQSEVAAEMAMVDSDLIESAARQARISDMIKYTAIVISIAPMLLVYGFLQRYFVKGIMIGAIKG